MYLLIYFSKEKKNERKEERIQEKRKETKGKKRVSNVSGRDGAWRGTERSEVGISSPLCLGLD